MKLRQIDKDWDLLFDDYDILNAINSNGFFIISSKQINKVLKEYFIKLAPLTTCEISKIMQKSTIYHVNSLNTIERRLRTIEKWIEWILDLRKINNCQ